MDTLADRIAEALAARGMKPADLIRQKVLSKAGVYFLLDGTTKADKVSAVTVSKLCKALSVNWQWLLHGRGSMDGPIESEPTSQPARIDPEILAAAVKLVRQRFQVLGEDLETEDLELNAEPLALAYEYLAAVKAEGEPAGNVVDFSKYLRAQGARDAGTMGGDGGIHRKGGGRAAR